MSANGRYLGLDIGTTSLKAAVFDKNGKRLAVRAVDYTLSTDASTGYIEFMPERYIEMCKNVIDDLALECGEIDAISVDTQGETLIVTDNDGNPLYPAIVWLDNRATEEAEAITKRFGCERVYNVTGQPEITAGWPASKMLWLKNNKPEIFSKIGKIFMLEDWVLYGLTGRFVTEPTIQSSTIYYDIVNGDWWGEMLSFVGIERTTLPEIVPTATKIGEYKGIPVVSGMLDQIAGTIGAGVTDGEKISEMTGTIMAICALSDEIPEFRSDSIIPCHVHAIPGKFCRILWSSTAGMALKWFKNELAEQYDFRELDELAEKVAPGCDGLTMLPYFCGSTMPKYNPDARAAFAGITLSHTRGHFARAIMEAIAFTLRQDLEYIGTEKIKEIRITGGGAKSPLWASIKADVTGKVLRTVTEEETACLGSALCAAVGIGVFSSIEEAAESAVSTKKSYIPSGQDYEAAYKNYISLDEKLN
jgi:xylulokinase